MDRVWQAQFLGEVHGYESRNPDNPLPFDVLYDRQITIDAWYVAYADALDTANLAEIVHFTFIGGGDSAMSRSDIILHVVNHSTYHRGQVAGMLYHYSVSPPTMDIPAFLRKSGGGT